MYKSLKNTYKPLTNLIGKISHECDVLTIDYPTLTVDNEFMMLLNKETNLKKTDTGYSLFGVPIEIRKQ
jgi:hypothetical protein